MKDLPFLGQFDEFSIYLALYMQLNRTEVEKKIDTGSARDVAQFLRILEHRPSHPMALFGSNFANARKVSEGSMLIELSCNVGEGNTLKSGKTQALVVKVEWKKLLKHSAI